MPTFSSKPDRSYAAVAAVVLGMAIGALVLAGCGSSAPAASNNPQLATQAQSTPQATVSSTSVAAPNTSRPPSFVTNVTTPGGDKVKVEGRFGPPLPASESDVDQTALSECPPPANEGRSVVVRLDLVTTLESSLSSEVTLETSYVSGSSHVPVSFVMGFSNGAHCDHGEPGATNIDLGSLQPHQSVNFTLWVVLPDVITPDDPRPSERTLGAEDWLMAILSPQVSGATPGPNKQHKTTGSRVVVCAQGYEAPEEYIAVVGDTAKTIDETCPSA